MASILKTFAIAAGAGVAIGLCTTAGSRRASFRSSPIASEPKDILDIEPLLDRLEVMERRFEAVQATKTAPVVSSIGPSIDVSGLTSRLEAQDAEIDRLRSLVEVGAVEMEQRLAAEIDRRYVQAVAAMEQTVELKVSERIAAIERSLTDQFASIDSLRDRAAETDSNLKRLIVAIERLCERTQPLFVEPGMAEQPAAAPAPGPGPHIIPFESHLAEARLNQADAANEFRAKIYKEPEPELRKQRFPLARIFGMLALILIPQLLVS